MSEWRYRCPEGHNSIRAPTERGEYLCKTCYNNPEIDQRWYTRRLDMKTGELVPV